MCVKDVCYARPKGSSTFPIVFSLFFCFGFLAGVGAAYISSALLLPILANSFEHSASVVGLCLSRTIPLVLFAIALAFHKPAFLIPVTSFHAFCFGYCSEGVFLYCRDAGWLVQFLFLFSAILSLVPFLWLCLRHIGGVGRNWKRDFYICCVAVALFGSIDYFFVSPFLATLMC